jgi:homocysteine S-methyltransferase
MDGGVSTHLEHLIAPQTFSHRELWSSSLLLTHEGREYIQKGHMDWLAAGSNIVTTVTYQCHFGLVDGDEKRVVSQDIMTEMIQNGVKLAQQAVKQQQQTTSTTESYGVDSPLGPFVVASTGPYGAAMADGSEYTGKYPPQVTKDALFQFHLQKAKALWDCTPDGLAVETIPNLQEVGVICQVLKELQEAPSTSGGGGCWISLACRDGTHLNDGNSLQDALNVIQSMDPDNDHVAAVGVNCCDSDHVTSLVQILAQHVVSHSKTNLPPRGIVVYPNSGESWDAAKEEWKDGTGADDAEISDRLVRAVAILRDVCKNHSSKTGTPVVLPKIVLGGCCRTSEKTIASLRERVDILTKDIAEQGR